MRLQDTLDGALYGPAASALSLAHRTALDLLDKIAVTANYHFELGHNPSSISFGKIRRTGSGKLENRVLNPKVEDLIREGVKTLYGLVELADDYDAYSGRLRPLKDVRNASTHRFVLLHKHGSSTGARSADEIQRYSYDEFRSEAIAALKVARAAIQMLTEAIGQYEDLGHKEDDGLLATLDVPDYDEARRHT